MIKYPEFKNKSEKFKYIIENKDMLIQQKMMTYKEADGFSFDTSIGIITGLKSSNTTSKSITKSEAQQVEDTGLLEVKAVINTTMIMDSHDDVHIDGIWDKSLERNSDLIHAQEHKANQFNMIIADGDDVVAETNKYTWNELGYDFKGETEALEFTSNVKKSRNGYMYDQYKSGYVTNHSVGMRYDKLDIAINDDDYPAYKDLYEKYIDKIANKDYVESQGMFWAIFEATAIEGSAVPKGSNFVTPTRSVRAKYFSFYTGKKEPEQKEQNKDAKMEGIKAFLNMK